jgi:golgi to ER traffic protein 4
LYAARAVFPYLLLSNLRFANKAFILFNSRLSQSHSALGVQEVSSSTNDLRVYPSLPLLNFLGLLLLAIQRGSSDLFRMLTRHYATHIKDVGMWDEALAQIGEQYFGIRIPKTSNPLFDMMGSMLFGGGGGSGSQGGGASSKQRKVGNSQAAPTPPPPVDLD